MDWDSLPESVVVEVGRRGPDLERIGPALDALEAELVREFGQVQPGKAKLCVEVIAAVRDLLGLPCCSSGWSVGARSGVSRRGAA